MQSPEHIKSPTHKQHLSCRAFQIAFRSKTHAGISAFELKFTSAFQICCTLTFRSVCPFYSCSVLWICRRALSAIACACPTVSGCVCVFVCHRPSNTTIPHFVRHNAHSTMHACMHACMQRDKHRGRIMRACVAYTHFSNSDRFGINGRHGGRVRRVRFAALR